VGPSEQKDRQRAALIASLALAVALIVSLGFAFARFGASDWSSTFRFFGVILISSWVAYALARTRLYPAGALVLVLGFCVTPFLVILSGPSAFAGWTLLFYLPLGLVVGGFVLSPWLMGLLLSIISGGFLLLPYAGIELTSADWAAMGSAITAGIVILVLTITRNRAERRSLRILEDANAELASMHRNLEERVDQRTSALNRRTAQLEAASFVSRQTSGILDPTVLLDEVVNLVSDRFGYYHAGIFLLDTRGQFAVLQAASSEGGKSMLGRGHRLEVGREGIVGYAAYERRARIALDVGEEAAFFNNPDLPRTRSEMALPLIVRGRVIGVMDIQSTEPQAFSTEDVSSLQSLADQTALALDNARLLAESRAALKQLESVTSESSYRVWRERLSSRQVAYRYTPLGTSAVDAARDPAEGGASDESNTLRVPILLRGKELGRIALSRKGVGQQWTENELSLLADISTQLALALDNARLVQDLQERAHREQAIAQAASVFGQTTDMDTLLQLALREFHQLPAVEEVSVILKQTVNGQSGT
jgi:GAF domain-containing protein